ncbi:MAG: hypothetical protein Q8903_15435 [Bacteroidota bacterium]|nr:hypothetical protein [Bacteroidota bacterium]
MKKIKLILMFLLVSLNFYSTNKRVMGNNILSYENYDNNKIVFLCNLDKYKLKVVEWNNGDNLESDMLESNQLVLNKENDLYNFICEQDLVSGWLTLKKDFTCFNELANGTDSLKRLRLKQIEWRKSVTNKISLIGKVNIFNNFTSLLIQADVIVRNSNVKELYLLNVRNQEILSIIKVAFFFSSEDIELKVYTSKIKENTYLIQDSKFKMKRVKFSINKDGKVVF